MTNDVSAHAERLLLLEGRGTGAASETVVEIGERRGYTVGATGPGTFRLVRSTRPQWAVVLAVILAPFLGLGLLFLRVRHTESGVITIFEDREGTKARIVGEIDTEIVDHLNGPPQQSAAAAPQPGSAGLDSPPSATSSVPLPAPPSPATPNSVPAPLDSQPSTIANVPSMFAPSGSRDVSPSTVEESDIDRTIARPRRATSASSGAVGIGLPDGRVLQLGSSVVLGRSPTPNDGAVVVALQEPSMSKTHVSITGGEGCAVVTDLHSTNGTSITVDGVTTQCVPGSAVVVPAGGRVSAGEVVMEIRMLT